MSTGNDNDLDGSAAKRALERAIFSMSIGTVSRVIMNIATDEELSQIAKDAIDCLAAGEARHKGSTLTLKQAAGYIGCTQKTITRWCQDNPGLGTKGRGGRWKINRYHLRRVAGISGDV